MTEPAYPAARAVADTVQKQFARHIAAAHDFTDRFAHSRLSAWKVRAGAAGGDCAVLTVDVSIILDELGTGVAGQGAALNQTIRRANPALQQTDPDPS